ncbi:DUF1127 domain-containing protein [Paracoccus homiensis]|uniref:DUF1127 domain-containing protein n=1 Tax=Paracoccus homiensis TaxID=364199 RepID=A0A1I0FVI1_9RHOB|nr:DUF1127 domain-containing protein [Paracoccus homiensis]SET62530.1 hypothetical protein SAMN04489858_10780 [Paracoccus homiensis]
MAGTATVSNTAPSLGKILAAPFVATFRFLVLLAEASPTMRQLNQLSQTSDEELAKRGVSREDEVRRIMGVNSAL